jgi:lantibiotic modifying enzyme
VSDSLLPRWPSAFSAPEPGGERSAGQAPGEGAAAFLDAAVSLGARVCRDALWAGERCNWIGPATESLGGRWRQVHRAYGPDLYGGTAGIALFLARLHAVAGERVFRRTALGAVRHALDRAEDIAAPVRIGAYSGWPGLGHAALSVARLLDEDSLRGPALALLDAAAALPPDPHQLDVLAGCAGAIAPLLLAHEELGAPASLVEAAIGFGDHLIATAVRSAAGWSWGEHGAGDSRRPWIANLTGFSHGAGGIGWSLVELYRATGEARFREAGEGAFSYERHWFDEARGNWPDLREPEASGVPAADGPAFMTAWCHGAPGIGLSRLRAHEILGGDSYRREAEAAIRTTLASLEGGAEMSQNNYSLCHGMGGNCDLLLYGSAALGDPAWRERAEQIGRHGIAVHEEQQLPWPCGTFANVEVPGLMMGLSGIGYFFLRLAAPGAVPSVLIFRPSAAAG